jgi:hypothetical protein
VGTLLVRQRFLALRRRRGRPPSLDGIGSREVSLAVEYDQRPRLRDNR